MPQAFSKKGFTLIELLVVIVVIGILATLATVGMKSARSKATDSKKVSEVRSVSTALEMYMMDEGQYPPDIQNKWGQPLVGPTSGKTYMTLPKQLSGSSYGSYCRGNDSIYIYNWINNGTSYTLSYCLDNPMNSCPPGPKTARPNLVMDCDNQTSACLPDCTNTDGTTRSCGDNGCGGSCGSCGGSLVCKEDTGSCVACVGDGDCSGSGQHCIGNACLPCRIGVPADCSLCQTCNASNTCEPVAVDTVEGRCSTVGCGTGKCTATQTCGFNNNFETCTGGFCIADGSCCTPETCASRGFNCGTFNSTNCPGVVVPSCGTCATGSCTNNQCCTPAASNLAACTTAGVVSCGGESVPNGTCLTCASTICASTANTKICDPATKKCVECTADTDCGACKRCNNNTCVNITAGTADSRCVTSGTCYTGTCNGSGSCNIYNDGAAHGCVTSGGYTNRRCNGNSDGSCSCTASACGGLTGVAPGYSNGCGATCNSACTDCGSSDGYCHPNRTVTDNYSTSINSAGYCDSCGGPQNTSCSTASPAAYADKACSCCPRACADSALICGNTCRAWRPTATYSLGAKFCSGYSTGGNACNCQNTRTVCP
ncbi:MAG: type II secretion system protein [Patescibacteria group bacterium]|nr:type II secretion system protein [Patescibacteria group bacterium]